MLASFGLWGQAGVGYPTMNYVTKPTLIPAVCMALRFRGKDKGAFVLSHAERAARRTRTPKDEQEEIFRKQDEIEQYVTEGFPREVEDLFDKHMQKARNAKNRLLDPLLSIEKLKVTVAPPPPPPPPATCHRR